MHPASSYLASESRHIESLAGEHDLHAFQAMRQMDEVLVANFMVFNELVTEEHYDLWVGDEAWDVDHFLHENPELKRAPFAWLTDFVGWLPMPDGGSAEAALTTDYNAEMVEHIARYPRLRDKALFVGNPDDVVADGLGAGLPGVREWTEEHFDFTGYVTGFDAGRPDRPGRAADRLGYGEDEKVCIVSVGGSGLASICCGGWPSRTTPQRRLVPGLRMVLVAGPRIDPRSLPRHDGLEVAGFVPDLHRHLAACDIAVVQGGLTTTMELVAAGRPFLYFPLRHHFEQTFHVAHRLRRHRAGRCLDWDTPTGSHRLGDRGRAATNPRLPLRGDRRCDPSRHRAQRAVLNRGNDMRAREPDVEGYIERDGVKVGYEVFGSGSPTLLLLPAWSIVHSRIWKAQVPLPGAAPPGHHFRPAGERPVGPPDRRGRDEPTESSWPTQSRCSTPQERSRQCSSALSMGNTWALRIAADHPSRVLGWARDQPLYRRPPSARNRATWTGTPKTSTNS